jgi:hypothetical protein
MRASPIRLMTAAAILTIAACAGPGGVTTSTTLAAGDAATQLAVGQHLTMNVSTHAPRADTGQDPLVIMALRHPDGRTLAFEEANHAPMHVMAQTPGGPLAQIMGLFGEERPTLYMPRRDEAHGAPFICGPEGPAALGVHEGDDGVVRMVGLQQQIQFEQRPDGQTEAVPYSPDQVCARLSFQRG